MAKLDIIAYVPDGTGRTVLAACLVDTELVWNALDAADRPLSGCAPALILEITSSDRDGWIRQECSQRSVGTVPDYKAWARLARIDGVM